MASPRSRGKMLASRTPRLVREESPWIWYAFSGYTRPRLVKKNRVS